MWRKSWWTVVLVAFFTVFVMKGALIAASASKGTKAKYLFLFIGDGMAAAQRNAAELYLAKEKGVSRPEEVKLVMNTFPAQGKDRINKGRMRYAFPPYGLMTYESASSPNRFSMEAASGLLKCEGHRSFYRDLSE